MVCRTRASAARVGPVHRLHARRLSAEHVLRCREPDVRARHDAGGLDHPVVVEIAAKSRTELSNRPPRRRARPYPTRTKTTAAGRYRPTGRADGSRRSRRSPRMCGCQKMPSILLWITGIHPVLLDGAPHARRRRCFQVGRDRVDLKPIGVPEVALGVHLEEPGRVVRRRVDRRLRHLLDRSAVHRQSRPRRRVGEERVHGAPPSGGAACPRTPGNPETIRRGPRRETPPGRSRRPRRPGKAPAGTPTRNLPRSRRRSGRSRCQRPCPSTPVLEAKLAGSSS